MILSLIHYAVKGRSGSVVTSIEITALKAKLVASAIIIVNLLKQ